jgi:hypothetical protein
MRRIAVAAALLLSAACSSRQKVAPPVAGTENLGPGVPSPARPGETIREYDLNHDGRTDVWTYSVTRADGKELVVRKERDLNNDGRVDSWEEFDADGALVKQTYDLDFVGKPDVTMFFE